MQSHLSSNHNKQSSKKQTFVVIRYGELAHGDVRVLDARPSGAAPLRRRPGGGAELRLSVERVLQRVRLLRHHQRLLWKRVSGWPVLGERRRRDRRFCGERRHRGVLQRHQVPGRQHVRRQELLHAPVVPGRRPGEPQLRERQLQGRLQEGDSRLLCPRHARDRTFLLHRGDQRGEQGLLRREEHAVAVLPGEGVLRPRAAAAVVELQLRAGGEERRLRRAEEPGEGGAGSRGGVQGGAMVLDEQRAPGHVAGVRRHDQGHQRRGVRRRELRRGERAGGILQGLLQEVRGRPREQPHLLGVHELMSGHVRASCMACVWIIRCSACA